VLTILMIVTMTLSDVLNNTTTTIVAAPVALYLAEQLEVSPDPFLIAVAIAASAAFLTPIGHKNNTIILGPGISLFRLLARGTFFRDYDRCNLYPGTAVVLASVI
jgi:di/tricarboxylate transporter